MKFTEMPYQRPDVAALKAAMEDAAAKIANASGVQEQIDAFEAYTAESVQWNTLQSLSYVRNTVNTKDEFYAAEREYFDTVGPELQEVAQKINAALLDSPFRKELEAHYGTLLFKNMEISRRSFKPELIPLMQEESKLEMQYQKLYAGMTVEFDGQTMPLPMLGKYKESADRAVRRAAFEAEGKVFDAHQAELDEIYDKLVKVRNAQGRLLGYDNYIQLGYDRLGRNCYGKEELNAFREQIATELVPIIAQVKEAQRKRIGVDRMCIYDDKFRFTDGNAAPEGPFVALHLSGGTTELLDCRESRLELLGGSEDLHAGQLVDRVGVAMGLSFPAGPALERLAVACPEKAAALLPASVSRDGLSCHLSGVETQAQRLIRAGELSRERIAAEVYDVLARTVARLLDGACRRTGARQALVVGGVASSALLRRLVGDRLSRLRSPVRVLYGQAQYSADNAAGVASIGMQRYLEEHS